MAQTQKTKPEAEAKAPKAPFRTFQCKVDKTVLTYRTRLKPPIAVLVGVTPEGGYHVYRWTSSEKLQRRGISALKKSEKYARVEALPVTEITGKDIPVLKQGTHNRTGVVVTQAEFEAARALKSAKKASAEPLGKKAKAKPVTKIFGTKKSAIENRPEGMTIKQAKAALKTVDGGFAY